DREQQKPPKPVLRGVVEAGVGAQGGERAELKVGERVDVGVAQVDGSAEHPTTLEQLLVTEHREDTAAGEVELVEDAPGEVRRAGLEPRPRSDSSSSGLTRAKNSAKPSVSTSAR